MKRASRRDGAPAAVREGAGRQLDCVLFADSQLSASRSGKWVFPRVLLPAQEEAHRAALLRGGGLEGGGGSDSDSSSS